MWSLFIIVMSPPFDDDFRFPKIPEPLSIQAFVAQLTVEALVDSILPRLARFDEGRLHTASLEPLFNSMSNQLRAIITLDVCWMSMQAYQP